MLSILMFFICLNTLTNATLRLYTTSPRPCVACRLMIDHKIIPDVFYEHPRETCDVIYPNVTLNPPGKKIPMKLVLQKPINITWKNCHPEKYYFLLLTDIDGARKTDDDLIQWTIWCVYDIINCSVSQGKTKFEYDIYDHPRRKGVHRHVFQIIEQQRKLEGDFPVLWPYHTRWTMLLFNLYRTFPLKVNPVAANFFFMHSPDDHRYESTKPEKKSTLPY